MLPLRVYDADKATTLVIALCDEAFDVLQGTNDEQQKHSLFC